ncbi:hypothetical protein LTR08_008629 [Meristemomyces frigidus]|nr:hypothetical protein LTR08_008629 [Meristemomyces frigidus]
MGFNTVRAYVDSLSESDVEVAMADFMIAVIRKGDPDDPCTTQYEISKQLFWLPKLMLATYLIHLAITVADVTGAITIPSRRWAVVDILLAIVAWAMLAYLEDYMRTIQDHFSGCRAKHNIGAGGKSRVLDEDPAVPEWLKYLVRPDEQRPSESWWHGGRQK